MGNALLTLVDLITPLHSLASRMMGAGNRRRKNTHLRYVAIRPTCPPHRSPDATPSSLLQQRPVRVVRIIESGRSPWAASRVRISGRMADVCAELDQLVALETAGEQCGHAAAPVDRQAAAAAPQAAPASAAGGEGHKSAALSRRP